MRERIIRTADMALFPSLREKLAPDNIIRDVTVRDIRFPTSLESHGTDAVHTDPDYSAAYVVLSVSGLDVLGHGHTFTLGRGTEIVVCAIRALLPIVLGRSVLEILTDFGAVWRELTNESQLRWLGPEKGVTHLAVSAVVNSLWDLWGKIEGKPVWKLLADMTPEETISLIDFRYITDALSKEDALGILREKFASRGEREVRANREGYALYTTSAGWLGYSDERIQALCAEAIGEGITKFKMKVRILVNYTCMINTWTLEREKGKAKILQITSQGSNLSKKNCCLGWDLNSRPSAF